MQNRKSSTSSHLMHRAVIMCATLLILVGTIPVRADLKIVSNVKVSGAGGGKKGSSTITTYIKGNRTRSEMSDGVILIYDHSTDLLYRIDPKKKTQTVVSLKPMFTDSSSTMGPAPKLIAKIEVKPGSASKMIAGRTANSYVVTGSFTTQMEGVPSANMLSYTMEAEFWMADGPKPMPPNSELLAAVWYVHEGHIAPQQYDSSASKALRMQGIDPGLLQQTLSRGAETAWYPSLKPILEKIAPLPGAILASKITMRLSRSPLGGSGVTIEATSVSEETLDDALFTLPTEEKVAGAAPTTPVNTAGTPSLEADPNNYEAFVGVYAAPSAEFAITREGSKLFGQGPGQPREEFVPQAGGSFLIKKFGANITFFKDGNGQVTHLRILLHGQEIQAKKVR